MTAVQPDIWFSSLAFSVVALLATIVRCAMLLVGLLVTLSRAAERDRPYIFREFAHAIIRRNPADKESISVSARS